VAQDSDAVEDSFDAAPSEDNHRVRTGIAHGSEELPADWRNVSVSGGFWMELSPDRGSARTVGIREDLRVPKSNKVIVGGENAPSAVPTIDGHPIVRRIVGRRSA
jgi:hypothetical protein